ncbi:MAG: RluA family pseudouridine synthase [Rhodoferax sp.]|nr:RluA family pseudouridine synthase [Rhodoferax sp.]
MSAELVPVYADDAIVVLEKPAGLLSVPGRGADKQDCLSARVQCGVPDALVVHRLDMATSGLMLMARGKSAQRELNRMFAQRSVTKRYVALVHGQLGAKGDSWQVIDLPIALDWENRPRRVVDPESGKASLTRWRVLAHQGSEDFTRLELEPVTGRSHQLRVHLHAIGHPIVGDTLYGRAPPFGNTRLMLHACQLELLHPVTGAALNFNSVADF